jgi:hypothetical protein
VSPIQPPPPGNGPWRMLILNRDPADSFWVIFYVAAPQDIHPATIEVGGQLGWHGVGAWVTQRTRYPVIMTAMPDALIWRLDQERPRGG